MSGIWYIPSFFGDIAVKRADKGTLVEIHDLTAVERTALEAVNKICAKKKWGEIDLGKESQTLVDAPFDDLHAAIAKQLKGERKTLDAVVFKDGKIEETSVLAKDAKAGVTATTPTIGCPQPEFDDVTVRATRVLETFLTPEQLDDFRHHQAFIAIGGETGHAYQITSRNAREMCRKYGQVFDIDEQRSLCVHDWEAPAPEEMLALKLHIELPGREGYVRMLPLEHIGTA